MQVTGVLTAATVLLAAGAGALYDEFTGLSLALLACALGCFIAEEIVRAKRK